MRRYTSEGTLAALMEELGFDDVFGVRERVRDYYGSDTRSVLDGVLVKEYDPDEGLDVTEMLRIAKELQIERAEADEKDDSVDDV